MAPLKSKMALSAAEATAREARKMVLYSMMGDRKGAGRIQRRSVCASEHTRERLFYWDEHHEQTARLYNAKCAR